jgi:hypothetical protein
MQTTNVPNGYRPFPSLLPPEQDAAQQALTAASVAAIAAGADAVEIARVVARNLHQVALAPDGEHLLLIEHPQRPVDPRVNELPISLSILKTAAGVWDVALDEAIAAALGPADDTETLLILLCRGEVRPMSLVDGLKLLASPTSPALVLGARRSELAALRADYQAKKKAEQEATIAESRRQQEHQRAHGRRYDAWNKLPREVQLFTAAAHRCGQQQLARALADVYGELQRRGGSGELYTIPVPSDWREDLIERPRPSVLDTPTNGAEVPR